MIRQIVIIGNGISGITAARHIRKNSDDKITVISSETEHFFSRTALMYIYMGHMKYEHTKPYEDWFWKKNRIDLVFDHVESVDINNRKILTGSSAAIEYDVLIIATGSKPNKFGWPGQDLNGVHGMYSRNDLDMLERNSPRINNAVVVGGGLIGIELVEMLLSRNIGVTFLVREKSFWSKILPAEESEMINRIIRSHHVNLKLKTELKEILGDEEGYIKSVIDSAGEEFTCQFVGLTVGVSPNISFLLNSGIETDRGVLVDEYLETNVKDVYAIGDCAQHRTPPDGRKPVEQVWYTGRIMGETVAQTITRNRLPYKPGIWFNSAKFFDTEYQTYGWVFPTLKDNEDTWYRENIKKNQALRLVFLKENQQLTGVNALGIRLRHDVLDKWITEGYTADYMLEHLSEALFDPEFFLKPDLSTL
ncbi:MAG: FAD/NAD(P)-binding oxidoreductase [Bacteroidales bacterium]|nr:FAD/NAD(P)-binding oxidoreductase [Bacteroidales bacterium]MDT8374230.1 FAD/NAD(P)-binding oxidoreductase [Bacteroidales bacterium]